MKKLASAIILCSLILCLVGCGASSESTGTKIYYVATDKNSICAVPYEYQSDDLEEQVDEALTQLSTDVEQVDYVAAIPSGVEVDDWAIEDGSLHLYLTGVYATMDSITEILVRSAVVKTLVQLDGVDSVSFYLDNSPLVDTAGNVIGSMTAETFIDDFGEETDSLLYTELKLYFASADGASIVAENREVYYSRNVSLEKLVIDQLLKGPDTEQLMSAIPSETKLISVTTTSGICYVNFDASFETAITGVTENATIYAIVDSLTELDSVKQVQLLVNGETPHLSNLDVDLSSPINRNSAIIHTLSEVTKANEDPGDANEEDASAFGGVIAGTNKTEDTSDQEDADAGDTSVEDSQDSDNSDTTTGIDAGDNTTNN